MRFSWLVTLGITGITGLTGVGCKDKEAPRPGEKPVVVPPGSGVAAPKATGVTAAPPTPRLDPTAAAATFDAEEEDKEWAATTEAAIKASSPELTDVDCKQRQCRATLSAATDVELARMADKLSGEDSVRGTGAENVLLTAPEPVNGKLSMKIYVTYER
jgi:hypothetical protein